jgi:sugar/nucleoside kinase (ribokinase family)
VSAQFPRIWIVGVIAWDTVLHVGSFPVPGGFTPKLRRLERPGGSAANVAQAVATADIEAGFVTVLGRDAIGAQLHQALRTSEISHLHIRWVDGESNHSLVLVDQEGDRTIIALAGDELDSIHLDDVPLRPGDIVVFVVWEESFLPDLERATAAGCITVVGLGALLDDRVRRADVAFGSHVDVPSGTDPAKHLDRFDRVVMTSGADGADQFSAGGVLHQPAFPAQVVDTTGAGDAFLAGYLATYAHGLQDGAEALKNGARWASTMVSMRASVPPPWSAVVGVESP